MNKKVHSPKRISHPKFLISLCALIACLIYVPHFTNANEPRPLTKEKTLEDIETEIASTIHKFLSAPENKHFNLTIKELQVDPLAGTSNYNTNGDHLKREIENKLSILGIKINENGSCKLYIVQKVMGNLESGTHSAAALLITYFLIDDDGVQKCVKKVAMEIKDERHFSSLIKTLGGTYSFTTRPVRPNNGESDFTRKSAKKALAEDFKKIVEPGPNGRLNPKPTTGDVRDESVLFASSNSDYGLEILVKRENETTYRPVPIIHENTGTEPQVELRDGDLFAVRLYNNNDHYDAGVELLLDGTNSLFLCRDEFPNQKWIIKRKAPYAIEGFLKPSDANGRRTQRLFKIVDVPKGAAATTADENRLPDGGADHGTITAIFYTATEKFTNESDFDSEVEKPAAKFADPEIQQGPERDTSVGTAKRIFGRRPVAMVTVRYTTPRDLPELP